MSIIKVDTIQDQDGNNVLNESTGTVTIGKSGNSVNIATGASFNVDSLNVNGTPITPLVFPTFTSISPDTITNAQTAITITGTNFTTTTTVEAQASSGAIYVADAVTYNSPTSITATFTLTVDGTYYIRVENATGLAVRSATAVLTVSDAPTWTTAAGDLGTFAGGTTGTLVTVVATSDSAVTYSEVTSVLTNASLANCQLNSSTGVISSSGGFGGASTSATTYSFTLRATDAEGQTADRAFTMTSSYGIQFGGIFN